MRIILHAPTAGAVTRARANLKNLLIAEPSAEVRIIVNADGVPAAINDPDAATDSHIFLCENGLRSRGVTTSPGLATVPAAVHEIVLLVADGWIYIRA